MTAHTSGSNVGGVEVESDAFEEAVRIAEAILFASAEPVSASAIASRIAAEIDPVEVLTALRQLYERRGVNLVEVGGGWAFRTAADLGHLFDRDRTPPRKLSRAALEVLATVAYHQPVTRAEIEEVRGVETSKGTLDILMEVDWVRMRGRRRSPGRPVTYGTTGRFLDHFGLAELRDLPDLEELKGAGFLSPRTPSSSTAPTASHIADTLAENEEPFTDIDLEELGLLPPKPPDD